MPAAAMPQSIFIDGSDRLLRTSDLLHYDRNYTFMCWVYITTLPAANVYDSIFSINTNSTSINYDEFEIKGASPTKLVIGTDNNGVYTETAGTTSLSANTWYHVAIVRSANNSRIIYLNGSVEVNHTSNISGRPAPSRNEIGGFSTSNVDVINARFSGVKMWSEALTREEILAEMNWLYPVRWRGLYLCAPLLSGHNDVFDVSGNGRHLSVSGTLTTADGPVHVGRYPPSMAFRLDRGR
jgi:hypothetical protein